MVRAMVSVTFMVMVSNVLARVRPITFLVRIGIRVKLRLGL